MLTKRLRCSLLIPVVACLVPCGLKASVIAQYTAGTAIAPTDVFLGQSVTTANGGPWHVLSYSFFSDTQATLPAASGTLFLLSVAYAGTPQALSASTAGFIAASQSISAGVYYFDPGVILQPNTQYFFYTNASFIVSGSATDTYTGGTAYYALGAASNFTSLPADANFTLNGTPVPEPGTVLLVGSAVLALMALRRRKQ